MLNTIMQNTMDYISVFSKNDRRRYGQFFTNVNTARYMASLTDIPQKDFVKILDPGSGNAILSAALIEKIAKNSSVSKIHLVLYENDKNILELLNQSAALISEFCKKKNIEININIYEENFILHNAPSWRDKSFQGIFDIIICNPPYLKISKKDSESSAMADIVYGQPNIYAFFMALSTHLLVNDGNMVFIVPRSWTSGLYFKHFRQYFLSHCSIETIHLFESRNKVFNAENVLQETMIIKTKKRSLQSDGITIYTSEDSSTYDHRDYLQVSASCCLPESDKHYVLIPVNEGDVSVLKFMEQFSQNTKKIGFQFKTGPVVEFRNRNHLRHHRSETTIPLIQACNLSTGTVTFGIDTEKAQYFDTEGANPILKMGNVNTVFIKRFTTKEESRRLQPALNLQRNNPDIPSFTSENHVNYLVKQLGDISTCEAYGFFTILSSDIWDKYYRILNGTTQVNVEDLNDLPVPDIETLQRIGRATMRNTENIPHYNNGELIRSIIR